MKINLYEFQKDAVRAFFDYCKDNPGKSPVLEMPTGSGKSVVIAEIVRVLASFGKKCLVLCRQKELVVQNAERMHQLSPGMRIGVYCAGAGSKVVGEDVTFATIQSVAKRAYDLGQVDLIIVDEAQHVPPSSSSQYVDLMTEIRAYNPRCRFLGLTATPYRLSSGLIYGDGKVFDDCCFAVPLSRMLDEGAITGWKIPTVTSVDMSGVEILGSDYNEGQMSVQFIEKLEDNVREILSVADGRKKCLCFATTVLHAETLKLAIENATGEQVGIVTGTTPATIRDKTLLSFKNGRLRWIVNCGVLTTGFDAPNVDLIAICRATKSHSLFYQILGRGMRKCPGKSDFLVLDFGDNFTELGDPCDPNYGRPSESQDRVVCPACGEFSMAEDVRCVHCDHLLRRKECPRCHEVVPFDTVICPGNIAGNSLFPEPCGRDLRVRRCQSMIESGAGEEKCDTPIIGDMERCPSCQEEIERRIAGAFNGSFHRAEVEPIVRYAVREVKYAQHIPKGDGKLPSMVVTYRADPADSDGGGDISRKYFREWICVEHDGFAKRKADAWWNMRTRNECPDDSYIAVLMANDGCLRTPEYISVQKDGKWDRIVSCEFNSASQRPLIDFELEPDAPF